jgi:cytochrome P450
MHATSQIADALAVERPRRELAELDGPRGWPLVGNTLQLDRSQAHRVVEGWARRYGPLFRFRLGRRTLVGVAGHELVGAVMRAPSDSYGRTTRFRRTIEEMNSPPGVFGSNGSEWERQRRIVMAGLDPAHIRAYFPSMLRVARRLERRWQRAADAGRDIDLQGDLMRFTVDTITGLAFGVDLDTLEADGAAIQQHLDKMLPSIARRLSAPLPYWRYFRLPADRRLDASIAVIHETIEGFIDAGHARLAADPGRRTRPHDVLEAMLVAADSPGSGVGRREVVGNVLNLLLAGEDTTAHSLAWLIWLLHRHPAALERARDEVRGAIGDLASVTPDALAGLGYLDACVREAMRLKPVAPMILREALCDTTLADLRIPAGTVLWLVMRHDGLSAEHFERPQDFAPERWLGAGEASAAKHASIPFGAGARICPGRYLALVEIRAVMAMLLGAFDIRSLGAADGGEVRERFSFTMAPVALRMRLARRRRAAVASS